MVLQRGDGAIFASQKPRQEPSICTSCMPFRSRSLASCAADTSSEQGVAPTETHPLCCCRAARAPWPHFGGLGLLEALQELGQGQTIRMKTTRRGRRDGKLQIVRLQMLHQIGACHRADCL